MFFLAATPFFIQRAEEILDLVGIARTRVFHSEPLKILILKYIDRFIGRLFAGVLTSPTAESVPPDHITSLLLIRPGGIGDAVHLIPALYAIREKFPGISIDILAEKRNSAIFSLYPHVRNLFHYDNPGDFLSVLRRDYDVVIDTEQWHRLSAVTARLIGARQRIGFGTNERSRLFNYPVSYSHDKYEVFSFLKLLAPLGIDAPEAIVSPWLKVPDGVAKRAKELLAGLDGESIVVIFPGASISERRWGVERFRSVATMLSDANIATVVVGGEEDRSEGQEIVRGLKGKNLAGATSLLESTAIIDHCAVLVSGDSGILHVGVGLGRSTVSLFGPGVAAKWAPTGVNNIVLNKHLSCSPCTRFGYTPSCKIGARCIADITPEEVYSAVLSLLNPKTP